MSAGRKGVPTRCLDSGSLDLQANETTRELDALIKFLPVLYPDLKLAAGDRRIFDMTGNPPTEVDEMPRPDHMHRRSSMKAVKQMDVDPASAVDATWASKLKPETRWVLGELRSETRSRYSRGDRPVPISVTKDEGDCCRFGYIG